LLVDQAIKDRAEHLVNSGGLVENHQIKMVEVVFGK